jgi:outer membrane protein OmpA-like peptidoglycan-associated protein
MNRLYLAGSIAVITGVFLAGCMTPNRNAQLEDARTNYRYAQNDPQVSRLASLELKEAQDALAKADTAWAQREDQSKVDHLAYIAQRKVAIAQETARRKGAEASVSQSEAERAKIQLAGRTEEAEKARLEAARAQQSAEASQQQAQNAETRARQLEAQLADLSAKKTERGMVVTLGDVLFDTNRARLKPGGVREVQKLAAILGENPQRKVAIEGFTDSTGSDERNQELSEQRANAVREVLLEAGISPSRITTRGYGKSLPVASNATEAGRQLNRRVEILLSDESGQLLAR